VEAKIYKMADITPKKIHEGCLTRLVAGKNALISFLRIEPHTLFPIHQHPHEQLMIVVEGEIEEIVEEKSHLLKKGNVIVLPSNIEHGGRTLDSPCEIIDIFSPPREDYLRL
jgi:quercetin dioxygenase-like cupin family protein